MIIAVAVMGGIIFVLLIMVAILFNQIELIDARIDRTDMSINDRRSYPTMLVKELAEKLGYERTEYRRTEYKCEWKKIPRKAKK